MGQLAKGGLPTMLMGGAGFSLRRLEAVRPRENGWHEPYELRGSRTDLWGTGGEIQKDKNGDKKANKGQLN